MDKQALVKAALHETEVDTFEAVGEHRRIVMIDDCDEVVDSVDPLLGLTTDGHVGDDGEVLYVRLDVVQILVSHVADAAYEAGKEAGKLAVIRALLERDVADVQHAFDDEDEDRRLSQWEADMCEAWLVRARAALGGDR